MTVEAWVNVTAQTGAYEHVVSRDTDRLRLSGSRQPQFYVAGKMAAGVCPGLELNKWYHLAGTFDGGGRLRVYINGQMCNELNDLPNVVYSDRPLKIGGEGGSDVAPTFPGYIQHVRISNIERTDFSYGKIDVPPSIGAGISRKPPAAGSADLEILSLIQNRRQTVDCS